MLDFDTLVPSDFVSTGRAVSNGRLRKRGRGGVKAVHRCSAWIRRFVGLPLTVTHATIPFGEVKLLVPNESPNKTRGGGSGRKPPMKGGDRHNGIPGSGMKSGYDRNHGRRWLRKTRGSPKRKLTPSLQNPQDKAKKSGSKPNVPKVVERKVCGRCAQFLSREEYEAHRDICKVWFDALPQAARKCMVKYTELRKSQLETGAPPGTVPMSKEVGREVGFAYFGCRTVSKQVCKAG